MAELSREDPASNARFDLESDRKEIEELRCFELGCKVPNEAEILGQGTEKEAMDLDREVRE